MGLFEFNWELMSPKAANKTRLGAVIHVVQLHVEVFMEKSKILGLALIALMPFPALADTSEVVASVSNSVSGTQFKENQQIVHLTDGRYSLGLEMIGDALGQTFAFSRLMEVLTETNAATGLRIAVTKPLSVGGLPFDQAVDFNVVDGANKFFVWSYGINSYGAASASYTTNISRVTAVPGPEAGTGLGAIALLGAAYWAKRRRNLKEMTT